MDRGGNEFSVSVSCPALIDKVDFVEAMLPALEYELTAIAPFVRFGWVSASALRKSFVKHTMEFSQAYIARAVPKSVRIVCACVWVAGRHTNMHCVTLF